MNQPDKPNSTPDPIAILSDADAAMLDRLLEARAAGIDDEGLLRLADEDPARLEQVKRLLDLVAQMPAEDPPADLAERTLAHVAENRQRLQLDQQISMLHRGERQRERRGGVFSRMGRWAEIGVAAAMILIGLSLMFPILEGISAGKRRAGCSSNLRTAGMGFGSYGSDHNDNLPRQQSTNLKPGAIWIRVGQVDENGQVQSNTAHYLVLVRKGYCNLDALACPENEHAPQALGENNLDFATPEARSFSYQNQFTPFALRIQKGKSERKPTMAIFADRSPMFRTVDGRLVQDPEVTADSNSKLHDEEGQNVLLNDLSVMWVTQPYLQKVPEVASTDKVAGEDVLQVADNLWTVYGTDEYDGDEVPTDPNDTHLVP